ncbi:MAG: 4'-phosphopantetheinyl transferase superfamily protein [Prolixibacteraceae bacterium]|nr:4'-phosphopantetheinyl transferase superfamily protein [Prolixibacteraceae bacterium]
MALLKTISIPNGILGIWQLTETSAGLLPLFTREELADVAYRKYTHEKRKVEWLATRLLIRELLGTDFTISYSENGKPLLNHPKYKYISISHSRTFASVVIHETLEVGIDIEDISRNFNPIEKRYLSDEELIDVNKNPLLQCLYWCTKEAVFKLVPESGVEFRQQITILPFNPEAQTRFPVRYTSENKELNYQANFLILSGHCLVWLTENSDPYFNAVKIR